jgi:murein L,D-transpeptidase YafK
MRLIKIVLALALAFGLASCGSSKFKKYNGPAVTLIQVQKSARKMYLLHNDTVLKSYDIALGFQPTGHKQFEGDGKTPEGLYLIDRRNPKSNYHLSLGISYPNVNDFTYASSMGKAPGGEIFIHGANNIGDNRGDWTFGCIAVENDQVEEIYAMVRDGTVVQILP